MSDNVRRDRAIRQALDTGSPQPPQGTVARHVNPLAALINGRVGSPSTHLPALAGKMVEGSHLDSRVKHDARWLQNERIESATYFFPSVPTRFAAVSQPTLAFASDGRGVGRGCLCWMISWLDQKRAIPLGWRGVAHPKGPGRAAWPRAFLAAVPPLLPAEPSVLVVGDGEFDGPQGVAPLTPQRWQ